MNTEISTYTFGTSSSWDFPNALLLVARMVLGVTFLASAAAKMKSQHVSLTQAVQRFSFDRLNPSTAGYIARLLPLMEFGLACFFDWRRSQSYGASSIWIAVVVYCIDGSPYIERSSLRLQLLWRREFADRMGDAHPQPAEIVALVMTTTSVCVMLFILGETSVLSHTRNPAST